MIKGFSTAKDVLSRFEKDKDKSISFEFQKYGYDLAQELGDIKNKSLYIKFAKELPRGRIETARNFVKDASNAKSKARLFMWKLAKLKEEEKNAQPKL